MTCNYSPHRRLKAIKESACSDIVQAQSQKTKGRRTSIATKQTKTRETERKKQKKKPERALLWLRAEPYALIVTMRSVQETTVYSNGTVSCTAKSAVALTHHQSVIQIGINS